MKSEQMKIKNYFLLCFLAGLALCMLSTFIQGTLNLRTNEADLVFLALLVSMGLGAFLERQRHAPRSRSRRHFDGKPSRVTSERMGHLLR